MIILLIAVFSVGYLLIIFNKESKETRRSLMTPEERALDEKMEALGILSKAEKEKYIKALKLIESHVRELAIRKKQLLIPGAYGVVDDKPWLDEIELFIEKIINPATGGFDFEDNFRKKWTGAGRSISVATTSPLRDMGYSELQKRMKDDPKVRSEYALYELKLKSPIRAAIHEMVSGVIPASDFSNDLTPIQYELFVADTLKKAGWDSRTTKASGDQGVDVVAIKDGMAVVIQCKLYSKPVGNYAVQEAISGREFENANYAVVVTNSTYTKSASQLAATANVLLLHHDELNDLDAKLATLNK